MVFHNKTLGKKGEDIAHRYLQKKGYEILHTNWYCRWGELDIVAKKEEKICFFEVKTRHKRIEDSLHFVKMNHLLRTIQFYVKKYSYSFEDIEVDFLGVEFNESRSRIVHYKDILEARI